MSVAASTPTDISNVRPTTLRQTALGKASILLAMLSIVGALVVLFYGLVLAVRWYNQPFLGALAYSNGTLLGTRSLVDKSWAGLAAGLQQDDRLVRIDEQTFDGSQDSGVRLSQYLATRSFGDPVVVEALRSASRLGAQSPAGCAAPQLGWRAVHLPL